MQQTICSSDYYFRQPILNIPRNIMMYHFSYFHCPFYAPLIPDGDCRLCGRDSINHRKYFIYSNYARKIQLVYLKYKFRKFYKNNFNLFRKINTLHFPLPVLVFKYKIKYYRNWSVFTLNKFINNIYLSNIQ